MSFAQGLSDGLRNGFAMSRMMQEREDARRERELEERKRERAKAFSSKIFDTEPPPSNGPMGDGLSMNRTGGTESGGMLIGPPLDAETGANPGARQPTDRRTGPAAGVTAGPAPVPRLRDMPIDEAVDVFNAEYFGALEDGPEVAEALSPALTRFKTMMVNKEVRRLAEERNIDITTPKGADQFATLLGNLNARFGDTIDAAARFNRSINTSQDSRAWSAENRAQAQEGRAQAEFDAKAAERANKQAQNEIEAYMNYALQGDVAGMQKLQSQARPGTKVDNFRYEKYTDPATGMTFDSLPTWDVLDADGNLERTVNTYQQRIMQQSLKAELPSKDKDSKPTQFTLSAPGEIPGTETQTRYEMRDGVAVEVPLAKADGTPVDSQQESSNDLMDRAAEMAKQRVKEMAGWLSGDKKDFADYGGSRAEAERQLTIQYYQELTGQSGGPSNGLTAPSVTQPTEATQPGKQKPVEAPQLEEGAQFADPSRGIIVIQGGKETVAWANGEQRRGPDGKIYELKNGKPVPVKD